MRQRATGLGGVIGLVLTCALGIAACGSGGTSAVSIKTLRAAVDNTQAAQSSHYTMDLAVTAGGKSATIHASGEGSADGSQLRVALDIPGLGQVEERLVDQTLYMDFGTIPELADRMPAGKHWVRISFDAIKSETGLDFQSLLDQAKSSSPTQGLQYLQGLSGDVEKVGDDTIGGAHATHYRASIDYTKVAAQMPAADADVTSKLEKLGTVPADVWIDDHDRVVKMHYAIDAGAAGTGGSGTAEFTMEITGFGDPVNIVAPPADETIDIAELGSQFNPVGAPLS